MLAERVRFEVRRRVSKVLELHRVVGLVVEEPLALEEVPAPLEGGLLLHLLEVGLLLVRLVIHVGLVDLGHVVQVGLVRLGIVCRQLLITILRGRPAMPLVALVRDVKPVDVAEE